MTRFTLLAPLTLMAMLLVSLSAGANSDFSLQGIDGKTYRLSDYRGKWVVVNYWATWCPPCRAEIPDLVEFHERNRERGAVVLGVAYEQIGVEQLRKFVDRYAINYPILRIDPGSPDVLGPIPGLPTTYLVSPEGEVVAQQAGMITGKAIEKFIRNYEK
ncbi:MAG TPA: TlpA family protein disulfide reductase [Gammaproteobacteria bacterium]|nr:TlpA family protein disulfide reductase [Gammaproteobacteria bacterium]